MSSRKATSFDVFGRRSRPFASATGAANASSPRVPGVVGAGFDGLADPLAKPSDTTGALGDSFYVAAVNTQMAVYDRIGVQVVAPIQLDQLHADSVGLLVFDPKVIYDQYRDTFLLVYLVVKDSTASVSDRDGRDPERDGERPQYLVRGVVQRGPGPRGDRRVG